MTQSEDIARDRAAGSNWVTNFIALARVHKGGRIDRHPYGDKEPSHDVVIHTDRREFYEVKHKDATKHRVPRYGLEVYRHEAMLEWKRQNPSALMVYVIHDWRLAGAQKMDDPMPNRIEHWLAAPLEVLLPERALLEPEMLTYRNSRTTKEPGYLWPTSLWIPLQLLWGLGGSKMPSALRLPLATQMELCDRQQAQEGE